MMNAKRIIPWALALTLALSISAPAVAMAKSRDTIKIVAKGGPKKSDSKKMIDFTLIPSSTKADEQSITIWCSGSEGSQFVGWRPSYEGASYSSTKGFTNITDKREFEATTNGWYAACILDAKGNFEYRLIQVKNIITHSKDYRGVPTPPAPKGYEKPWPSSLGQPPWDTRWPYSVR